ncbi:helix-turn-helix transcriptional regulator [Kribbella sp. NPDC003505]|uniref:helix-turn-helix domain-containing protein n=1 Tax=Kribbella sp. NPDC003505 TaxID=3154448 RepID=UPI0033B3D005
MAGKRTRLAEWRRAAGYSQERLAEHLGVDRSTVARWESGGTVPVPFARPRLAAALGVSRAELNAVLGDSGLSGSRPAAETVAPGSLAETDLPRRGLLRLLSLAGTVIAGAELVGDRSEFLADGPLEVGSVSELANFNQQLWRIFAMATAKQAVYPLVTQQLAQLVERLKRTHRAATRQALCELTCDLFQLAGEVFFDNDQYTSAAHCYTLAAQAAREAGARDMWACALTRHAFISVYEQQFAETVPMLTSAADLAANGDSALSTRYWVSAVQAEAAAGLGDLSACERALERAEQVRGLGRDSQTGGWLRFDGSRLPEQRGTCYTLLGKPDLAEKSLQAALNTSVSLRRRGSVLVDLANVGVMRRDVEQTVSYATAAMDLTKQSGSGVIARKLSGLNRELASHRHDAQLVRLSEDISARLSVERSPL